jgi:hypothetical protein
MMPKRVSDAWLQQNVPARDEEGLQTLLGELLRRGWTESELNARVLPHYRP